MKLKYVICPECNGHKWSTISSCFDIIKLTCRCGAIRCTKYHYMEVPYPDVTIENKEIKAMSFELEQFFDGKEYPFGVDVMITYYKESGRTDETLYNATEFHYMFDGFEGRDNFAVESNIHYQGGTTQIAMVKTIVISKSLKKHTNHYNY